MKRLLAGALLAAAAAHADTCERTVAPDGSSTIACPAIHTAPPSNPTTPTTPTQPPVPTPDPAPPAPSGSACPPNINPFICAIIGAGNPTGGGGSAPAGGGGGGFDRPAFDFRDGDSLRFAGAGTRSTTATHAATVSFSVGDQPGNLSSARHVTVTVNGQVVDDQTGVYVVTRAVPVRTGDVISLTITGDGVVMANARLALSP